MNYTDNYNLNLPSFNDSADTSALNENFSKIDKKLKDNADTIANVKITTDTTVKEGSTNPVSSGAVYTALQNVEIDVDTYVSETSRNPVQNKIIKQYVDTSIADLVAGGGISSDGRIQLKPNFANNISECIDTSKVYVLPDGFIYAYMYSGAYPEITIEELPEQYFWYNEGNPKLYTPTSGDASSKRTNLIPVDEGDILKAYLRGTDGHTCNGCWYDENEAMISPIMVESSSQEIMTTNLTAPAGAKYVQIYSMSWSGNVSGVVLEVEWVHCAASLIPQWSNTDIAFVPADYEKEILDHEDRIAKLEENATVVDQTYSATSENAQSGVAVAQALKTVTINIDTTVEENSGNAVSGGAVYNAIKNIDVSQEQNRLKGKKIVYDGDSICAPSSDPDNGGAYPKIIADLVGGTFDNQAVGGGRLVTAEGATDKDGNSVTLSHSIVDNLVNLPTDGDLYCFEGGVNDHWNGVPLGDFDATDYTGTLDTKTMCGALEYIFRYAITSFVGKPICFIITHKCRYQNEINGNSFADFRDKMIGLCEKYAIPYYDAWAKSGLGSWSEAQLNNYFVNFSTKAEAGEGDGTHPNTEGYKRYYIPQLVSLFEKILPMGIESEEPDDGVGYTNILDEVGYEEGVYIASDGSLASYTGRYVTGLIPCAYNDIVRLKNVSMPDDKSDYQNQIAYYYDDGTLKENTRWNLVTGDGGTTHNAIYEDGNLIQFTVSNDGPIRLCCTGIDETSIITVNQVIE